MQSPNARSVDSAFEHAPSADDVRKELRRMFDSPDFPATERRCAFLRFVVDEALAGRAARLKGYTIGIAVFGRDNTFDPDADPVVRVEARRLRRDLASYYLSAGSRDRVRISIPTGSYAPHFEWHQIEQLLVPPIGENEIGVQGTAESDAVRAPEAIAGVSGVTQRTLLFAALFGTVVAVAGLIWLVMAGRDRLASSHQTSEPAVVVAPFNILSSDKDAGYLADGVGNELVRNLMRFPGFRVYALRENSEIEATNDPIELAQNLGVTYVVTGSMRVEGGEMVMTVHLLDASTNQVRWSETYERVLKPHVLIATQSELADKIATAIGQPYGAIRMDVARHEEVPDLTNMQSYICVLHAYDYRKEFAREKFNQALQCLEETVRRDPNYTDAWAMLGFLHADAGRNAYGGEGTEQLEYEKAWQAASRAVKLGPNDPLALKALSAVEYFKGQYDESERLARQALALNPYDPEALAQLGWRLAARGRFDEGIPLLEHAIQRSANPPGWYYVFIVVDLYLKGNYEEMLRVARRSADDARGFSQVYIAIAAGALGDKDAARQALGNMARYRSITSHPDAILRRHGVTEQTIAALMAGLQNARQLASRP